MCNHQLGGANLDPRTLFSLMCHTTDNQFLLQIVWMNWNHSSYCNSILLMRPISYEMQRTILSRSIYLLEALQKFDRSLIKSFVIQILVAIRIHTRRRAINVSEPWTYFFRVSSLAYPNLLGKKGYVVVVVLESILEHAFGPMTIEINHICVYSTWL